MNIKKLILPCSIFALFFGIFCMGRILWLFYTPLLAKDQAPIVFKVDKGMPAQMIVNNLAKLGILSHPKLFLIMLRLSITSKNLQFGEYVVEPKDNSLSLLHKIVSGTVILYPFTIVEGTTFNQLLLDLQNNTHIQHLLTNLTDEQIMAAIGHQGVIPEGRFFPDTYKFPDGTKDIVILNRAFNLMDKRLSLLWSGRDLNVLYPCKYKALIAASIIEKETAIDSEKPIIAGVIIRRLNKNMLLQMDPTVIYGLGNNFTGKLTRENLQQATPYNTYLYKGLPPSPICMPSISSIYAALHPDKSRFLFYVSKGNGTHEFSETLEQQNAAVKTFIH